MDLRTETSLSCGALAIAIAVSMLLRGHPRRAQYLFAAFAANIGLWYLAQWLYQLARDGAWARVNAALAVLMPQLGLHLFDALFPEKQRPSRLLRFASVLLVPMFLLAVLPDHEQPLPHILIFVYVFGLFAAGLGALLLRGERSGSRATQRRVRFLVVCGALAGTFSIADFLWFIGAPLPPVGEVLSVVFLFVLAESLVRERLVDHYEMLGLALVSTALAFSLAGIFYVFVVLLGGFQTMYLNAVLGGIVMLVLFDPLRDKMGAYIHRAFFLERVDLERAVNEARRQLAHVIKIEAMLQLVLQALESSRRVTAAAIYLRDPIGEDFELNASFGGTIPTRIDGIAARPLVEQLKRSGSVSLEDLRRVPLERKRSVGLERENRERLLACAELFGALGTGIIVGVRDKHGEPLGILAVIDERVKDAFASEDVSLLESLAIQVGIVIENSREYELLQERERLRALGEMAAGLAHEIKNPLGAIKGAAQLLSEPDGSNTVISASQTEFLGIILEEVDRLDRVVGSVLDYARPSVSQPLPIDVNQVIERTVFVLSPERGQNIDFELDLQQGLPKVRADAEQLRQALINLIKNAAQAMEGEGKVTIRTRERGSHNAHLVAIAISDHGPGIAPAVRESLFVPFFTTKGNGTGLGLAISGRLIRDMGGRIDVHSNPGSGATFTVLLPAAPEAISEAFPVTELGPAA